MSRWTASWKGGYDVICVNIVDRTAAAVIIDKAQAAGVPVIFSTGNRWRRICAAGNTPTMWAFRREMPEFLQGELVLDAWRTQRDTLDRNGDGVIQYVMLEGRTGTSGRPAPDGILYLHPGKRRCLYGKAGQ